MKFYVNKNTGKVLLAHFVHGKRIEVLENGQYVDLLGEGNYNGQAYCVLRKRTGDIYEFKKVISNDKIDMLKLLGWEVIKLKGTNDLDYKYLEFLDSSIMPLKSDPLVDLDTVKRQYQGASYKSIEKTTEGFYLTLSFWNTYSIQGEVEGCCYAYMITEGEMNYIQN